MKIALASLPALILVLAASTALASEDETPPLPEDVAAIVRTHVISRDAFRLSLIQRFGETEEGRKTLTNLAERIAVGVERKRKGVEVGDDELRTYLEKVKRDVVRASHGTQTLGDVLKEKNFTLDQFIEVSRDYLVRQKLARAELGIRGEVSPHQLGVWMEGLKKRLGVVVGRTEPGGPRARVGTRFVTDREFGAELERTLPVNTLDGAIWDLVIAESVHQDLAKAGIEIEPADVEKAIRNLEAEFDADPRWKRTSFTFEQYVQAARKMSIEELRADRLFRAQVGLAKSIRRTLTADRVNKFYEANRDRYGEQRAFVHLLIKADDTKTPFGRPTRSYKQAKEIIDAIYVRYLRGTPFERLVKEASEDRSQTNPPDRVIVVTRASPLPDSLKQKVFTSALKEVVGPIRTAYGWHLLKVLEARPDRGLEAVRERVTQDLIREERSRALLKIREDPTIRARY